jgi:ABC-type phosphate transport system substrate-binding protein
MNQGENMKLIKYVFLIALVICATGSVSNAQGVRKFHGGGSSAVFNELGSASQAIPGVTCIWTRGGDANILARDARFTPNIDEQGTIFVAWGPGGGTCAAPTGSFDVYAYQSLDSVVGDRCYFEVDASTVPGCIQIFNIAAGTAGANKIPGITDSVGGIPQGVIDTIKNQHFFVAGTDIRPEDAKFAVMRALLPCNQFLPREPFNQDAVYTNGLGYQTADPNLGTQILGYTGGGAFNVANFNIVGNDPVTTTSPVPSFTTYTIGAQPILVVVTPRTGTGLGAATDINGFTLTLFYQGVLARSTDLFGPTTANPVTVYVREPLSGTYNTFEYSIPNSTQYHATQEYSNCSGASVQFNPMHMVSALGKVPGAFRNRVIGTGGMKAALQASSTDSMGYLFWSAGNAAGLTNGKYLKVDGIDPIQTSYSNGVIPNSGAPGDPTLSVVNFAGINSGNYPIWSALRLVGPPSNPGIATMLTALGTIDATQKDYLQLSNLKVWHSHFYINGIGLGFEASNGPTLNPATPNDLCPTVSPAIQEIGGDAGGTNVLKIANADFCADYDVPRGLINKTR